MAYDWGNYGGYTDASSSGSSWGSSGGDGWGQLFQAFLGGVSSYSSARASKDAEKERARAQMEALRETGRQQRATSAFESSLADYWREKQKERDRAGFANYNQFSRGNYAYTPPPAVGAAPNAADFEPPAAVAKPKTGGGLAGLARGNGG